MSASLVPPQPYSTSPDEAFLVTPIPGDLLEDTVSRLRIAASCGSSSGPPPFSSTTSFWRDGLRGRQSIGDDRATPQERAHSAIHPLGSPDPA